MSEETEIKKGAQEEFEANENLNGFFAVLLKVDQRVNPQHYKTNSNKDV